MSFYGSTDAPFPRKGPYKKRFTKKVPMDRPLTLYQKREIKRMIMADLEKKFIDDAFGYQQADYGTGMFVIGSMNQGAGVNQRVGDAIKYLRMNFKLGCYYSASLTLANVQHQLRCIIFKWNVDSSVTTPTNAAILATVGSVFITQSQLNESNRRQGDFTILMDETFSVGSSSSALAIERNIPMKGGCRFAPGAATGEGLIYLWVFADDVTGAHSPSLQFQYSSRIWFTDA